MHSDPTVVAGAALNANERDPTREVAQRLHISPKTVENHRTNIYRKCEVGSLAGLMRRAIQDGMVSL